ncbi:MAG: DUF5668 domain-containing protein [candidate division WOR-3 bacterium]
MVGIWFAITLIAVGALIWLANLGVLSWNWARDWPWILIALGALSLMGEIIRIIRRRSRRRPAERGVNRAEILRDLEEGRITAEEAERRLRGG